MHEFSFVFPTCILLKTQGEKNFAELILYKTVASNILLLEYLSIYLSIHSICTFMLLLFSQYCLYNKGQYESYLKNSLSKTFYWQAAVQVTLKTQSPKIFFFQKMVSVILNSSYHTGQCLWAEHLNEEPILLFTLAEPCSWYASLSYRRTLAWYLGLFTAGGSSDAPTCVMLKKTQEKAAEVHYSWYKTITCTASKLENVCKCNFKERLWLCTVQKTVSVDCWCVWLDVLFGYMRIWYAHMLGLLVLSTSCPQKTGLDIVRKVNTPINRQIALPTSSF